MVATLVVPLLALTAVSLVGVRSNLSQSARAARMNERARFAGALTPVIHELQGERTLSGSYIAGHRRTGRAELFAQRRAVDQVVAAYRVAAGRLDLAGGQRDLQDKTNIGVRELGKLATQRQVIDAKPITAEDEMVQPGLEQHEQQPGDLQQGMGHAAIDSPRRALDQYTDTINDLLDINSAIGPTTNDKALFDAVAASVALSRAKDFADLQRGLLFEVFSEGHFGMNQHGRLAALVAGEDIYTRQFNSFATPAQRGDLERILDSPEVRKVEEFTQMAAVHEHDQHLMVDPRERFRDASSKLDRLRHLEQRLSSDIVTTSAAMKADADRQALLYSLLLAATVLLAVAVSLVNAGVLIRRVIRLKDAADDVAQRRLPEVVQRLRDGERVELEAEPPAAISGGSPDELGQLARAFDSVHRVAVLVAGKEAALRQGISDMFLNLARRSQSLADQQLEVIRELRGQQQPAQELVEAGLGELDQLATRMHRNAENLIVLSGSQTARRWRGPAPISQIVGAALEEVKEDRRIKLVLIEDALVLAHAATDVVHLLAELLQNALTFSPPEARVTIGGQVLPGGYVFELEDQGIGMSDEQLVDVNERLADPPMTDLATGRMLGFFVVGQLIRRHGLKVQLRHSWCGGITALVRLPNDLLQGAALDWMPNGPKPAAMAGTAAGGRPMAALNLDLQGPERPALQVHVPLQRHPGLAEGAGSETPEQRQPG
jgi:signal transduction histidine kinase